MVLQSEYPLELISILQEQTWTAEYGESISVVYTDNEITTVHDTDSSPILTDNNAQLTISSKVDFLDAVGDDINAMILKVNTKGVSKNLFNGVTSKPNTTQISSQVILGFTSLS